jgi:predicted patatin/cPLA2 family phospholipase
MHNKTVIEIIAGRMAAKQVGEATHDNARLGLAVEGGGMRGIISAGMLLALKDLDMLDIFDYYTGVSAGSLNLAYVLAGQAGRVISTYFDDMSDHSNLNLHPTRLHHHVVMDIRHMYNDAVERKPLNEAVIRGKYAKSFKVAVSNVTKSEGELVSYSQVGSRFFEYLMAGATIPVIAGEAWRLNNEDYFDGGLYYINPSQAAEELNCTHALVLNTYPQDFELKPYGRFFDHLIKHLDDRYNDAGSLYLKALEDYCTLATSLAFGETDVNDMRMYRIATPHDTGVRRLTTDHGKLIHSLREGYQEVLNTFYPQGVAGILPTII